MAKTKIIVTCASGVTVQGLLNGIYKGIKGNTIQTWEADSDGDFTHVTSDRQWYKEAWLRPAVQGNLLTFNLIGQQEKPISSDVRGVYLGRFSGMLVTHFDNSINRIEIA